MSSNKLYRFKIHGHEATLLDGRIEVSVPDETEGSKIVMRLSNTILDRKIKSIRINMPNKIIFISAKDKEHLLMRAEDANDKKVMN